MDTRDWILKRTVGLHRFWSSYWPFNRGTGIFAHLLTVLKRLHLVDAAWRECNGLQVWLDPSRDSSLCLLSTGDWQPEVASAIVNSLPAGGTFVDVGANFGFMTMLAARKVGPTGRVFAIEPCPDMVKALRSHLIKNGISNVTVIEAGCSNHAGAVPLFIAPDRTPGRTSLSSKNAQSTRSVSVKVVPLADLLAAHGPARVDVLKIDVEGAEHQVLQGAREVLKRYRPVIITEADSSHLESFGASRHGIIGFLTEAGYDCEPLTECDILARPRD
jgi:FkbM family methyltransferase